MTYYGSMNHSSSRPLLKEWRAGRIASSAVVAEVSLGRAMIEGCAQLDAEIPRVQDQRNLGPERVWRGQHCVQLAQDRHEARDFFTE